MINILFLTERSVASRREDNGDLFVIRAREFETLGTMSDSYGNIPSRSMFTSTLGLALGIRIGHFSPALYGEYFLSSQINSLSTSRNQNLSGQGYLVGGELKWQSHGFSITGAYLFSGQYQLLQETTTSQVSIYSQPSGYGLTLGFSPSQNFSLFLMGRETTFNSWNLDTDPLSQVLYGIGIGYDFL